MARARSPAEVLFNDIVAKTVTPQLKALQFRKSGTHSHRRHGETVQVVNVQLSRGCTWTEKAFYINAGISFDAICALAALPDLDRPREYDCDDRGTRDRLENLIAGAPASWTVHAGMDPAGLVAALRGFMEQLAAELDQIDGLAAYRLHRWFDRFRPAPVNAQALYLLGDRGEAWREVQDLARFFADRQVGNDTAWWLKQLRLR